jgi:hypothetical protein
VAADEAINAADARATSHQTRATEKQLLLLKRMARDASINPDALSRDMFGVDAGGLSRIGVFLVIARIKRERPSVTAARPSGPFLFPEMAAKIEPLFAEGDRLGDFIMEIKGERVGDEPPDIRRPNCLCGRPARWVSGIKDDGSTFGMFVCAYDQKDERNCGVMFNYRGVRVDLRWRQQQQKRP